MRTSPDLRSTTLAFVNVDVPPTAAPPLDLGGRWVCRISRLGAAAPRRIVAGVMDLVHAGQYFVGGSGCAGPDDAGPGVSPCQREDALPSALEGPVFGAVNGTRVVLWVTDVAAGSMWVLQGRLTQRGIVGRAEMTQCGRVVTKARFGLQRG